MSRPIHLYISSSPDLYAEREAVAQIVAALPLTIGWRIGHTPLPGQQVGDDVVCVGAWDLYAVILGHDFAAPMGSELRQAFARGQRPMAAYRKAFEKAARMDPSYEEPLVNKALMHAEAGDHKKAVTLLEKVIKADPENREALYQLADSYQVLGETRKAKRHFEKLGMVLEVEERRTSGREIDEETMADTIGADHRALRRLFPQNGNVSPPARNGLPEDGTWRSFV